MSADLTRKFMVPNDIASKYNILYEMYKANVTEETLQQDGIEDLDGFKDMFIDDQFIELLLYKLPPNKKKGIHEDFWY